MRAEKTAVLEEIRGNLEGSEFVFLADYQGLTVTDLADLRGSMGEFNTRVQVIKNTLLRRALPEDVSEGLGEAFTGPTAMVFGEGDATEVAKALKKFIGAHNCVTIKGGCLDTQVLSSADIHAMADLPAREVMLGQFVGTVAAPMTQLVGVMGAKVRSLLYVLRAVEDKKNAAA